MEPILIIKSKPHGAYSAQEDQSHIEPIILMIEIKAIGDYSMLLRRSKPHGDYCTQRSKTHA